MSHPKLDDVTVLADKETLAYEAARRFVALAQASIQARGAFHVALAGGSTPKRLHELLASAPFREQLDWSRVKVFFGDERFVPPDDPESNVAMARRSLLDHVDIPAEQVFPFPTVGTTPEAAAEQYARTLLSVLGDPPVLDLILLGMGEDGHTASLFPGHPEVTHPSGNWVAAVHEAPKPPSTRLTLTYATIKAARHITVLVSGQGKAEALEHIFQDNTDHTQWPVRGIYPANGEITWLVDQEAASTL